MDLGTNTSSAPQGHVFTHLEKEFSSQDTRKGLMPTIGEGLSTSREIYPLPPIPTIHRTKDYTLFKSIGNREVVASHVKTLKKQMEERGYFLPTQPLVVSSDFVIDDGQHRFLAARSLGYSVCYVVADGLDSARDNMTDINAHTKKWVPDDFLKRQSFLKNIPYMMLENFIIEFNLKPRLALQLLKYNSGERNVMGKFKEGTFKLSEKEIKIGSSYASKMNDIRSFHPSYASFNYTKQYLGAVLALVTHPKYDHEHFLTNLTGREADIYKMHTSDTYLLAFSTIFNKRKRKGKGALVDFRVKSKLF